MEWKKSSDEAKTLLDQMTDRPSQNHSCSNTSYLTEIIHIIWIYNETIKLVYMFEYRPPTEQNISLPHSKAKCMSERDKTRTANESTRRDVREFMTNDQMKCKQTERQDTLWRLHLVNITLKPFYLLYNTIFFISFGCVFKTMLSHFLLTKT